LHALGNVGASQAGHGGRDVDETRPARLRGPPELGARKSNEEWKLIEANADNRRGVEERELYEMRADPREERNLATEEDERLGTAEEQLADAAERASEGAVEGTSVGLDAAAVERLRAIGYMEDEEPQDETDEDDE